MTLRIAFELPVAEDRSWGVSREADGIVTIRTNDDARTTIATARWADNKLSEKLIATGAVSRGQWMQIETHLRTVERAAQRRELTEDGDHVNFLLEPDGDAPPLETSIRVTPGVWKVRVDRSGLLVITALENDRLVVVATAQWAARELSTKQIRNGAVSKKQWVRVHDAVNAVKLHRVKASSALQPAMPVPYVELLLDLADGDDDRIVPGSLRSAPSADVPTGAFVWKVACDSRGAVWIWSLGSKLVGGATWNGTLIDRRQATVQVPTDYQWSLVERALVLAFEWRANEPAPVAEANVAESTEPSIPIAEPPELPVLPELPERSPGFCAFLLDIRDGSVVDGSVRFAPDPTLVPERVFVWEVTREGSTVRVEDRDGDRLATAIWSRGLGDTAQSGSIPTDAQWEMVRTALHRISEIPDEDRTSTRASEKRPDRDRRAAEKRSTASRAAPRRNRIVFPIVGAAAVVVAAIVVVAFVADGADEPTTPGASTPIATAPQPQPRRAPSPPPPPTPPAPAPMTKEARIAAAPDLIAAIDEAGAQPAMLAYYPVRWSELDMPPTTTIEQVEKEPGEELGKRLCVEGTLERITRADVAGRRHYEAALVTTQGDRVELVISGSAGTLVKRQAARVCGVVIGATEGAATIFGMFDLPENRNPVVERPGPG